MPVLIIIFVVLAGIMVFAVILLPLSIVLRFRAGTKRRRAWGWVVSLNFIAALLSASILLASAALSHLWIPNAFPYTLYGLGAGALLGVFGLATSHWERTPAGLHYRPNRWLILLLTLVVSARIIYGFWRGWEAWRTTPDTESWIAQSGAAGSMAAGAMVLGYYVIYWAGLRRKLRLS